jgi:hypothetical protein
MERKDFQHATVAHGLRKLLAIQRRVEDMKHLLELLLCGTIGS